MHSFSRLWSFYFISFICMGSILSGQSVHKPTVLILTTGGTIASQTGAPTIDGPALVQAVPQLSDYANITVEEFSRIGSSKMTPDWWILLVNRIHEILEERPELTSIVITHGTDTMEETAFFLNLTYKGQIPLILVGAMRSADEISADGPLNLINAVRVGTTPAANEKGVLVVLNEYISASRDLLKMNNRRVHTFQANDLGYLGVVDPDTVLFYRTPTKPHTFNTPFDVSNMKAFPKVDIVSDYAGFDEDIFSYFANRPNFGIVVNTFAGGRMSGGMTRGIEALKDKHQPIVLASGVKLGRIIGKPVPRPEVIVANDLPPNKARILLMLALTITDAPKHIQDIFDTY